MSSPPGALRITKRAKCRRSRRPNGTSVFCGSTVPGAEFIDASRAAKLVSTPALSAATTMKLNCGGIAQPLVIPVGLVALRQAGECGLGDRNDGIERGTGGVLLPRKLGKELEVARDLTPCRENLERIGARGGHHFAGARDCAVLQLHDVPLQ